MTLTPKKRQKRIPKIRMKETTGMAATAGTAKNTALRKGSGSSPGTGTSDIDN